MTAPAAAEMGAGALGSALGARGGGGGGRDPEAGHGGRLALGIVLLMIGAFCLFLAVSGFKGVSWDNSSTGFQQLRKAARDKLRSAEPADDGNQPTPAERSGPGAGPAGSSGTSVGGQGATGPSHG